MSQQEGLEVLSVHLLKAIAEEIVFDDPGHDGAQQVERREREAKLVLRKMSIDPQLPQKVASCAQGLAHSAERAGQKMIHVPFESMKLSCQKPYHLAMHFVLGGIAESVQQSRKLIGGEVDHTHRSRRVGSDRRWARLLRDGDR